MNGLQKYILCMPIIFGVIFVPIKAQAQQLIIAEENVSETIIKEQFSLFDVDSLFIDQKKLQQLMDRLHEQVHREPTDATLDEQGRIVSEKPGVILDRLTFQEMFYTFFYSNERMKKMLIPKKLIYPRVDSELLAEIRVQEIGSFQTYYNESNKERSHNIYLAATSINNHVVFPGEKFSFNEVVGKRTKEKGYKRAPVIVRGELSEDIGGGICQVSSTLFNAVNLEGIQMIERYSHSRTVPYVPPGKDATVSWWGPDFVFKNEYNHPILIRSKAKNGKMTVRIYSSQAVEKR